MQLQKIYQKKEKPFPKNKVTAIFYILLFSIYFPIAAQTADLRLTNNNTTIRSIIFRGNIRFTQKQLSNIIAEKAPTMRDYLPKWIKRITFSENRNFKFNPFELQRDVLRIKNHYQRNGFLYPKVDYLANLTQNNKLNVIDIIFTIQEGEPIKIEEAQLLHTDGRQIERVLAPELQESWRNFSVSLDFSAQRGYSELSLAQIGQQINSWLKNNGYAFAKTNVNAQIDSLYNQANLFIVSDIGKRAKFGSIVIDGLSNTHPQVVRNLLSFKSGEIFSVSKLIESRKRIFEASQFRAVFYEILPEDDADEARANIKFTVYEAKTKAFRLRSGFNLNQQNQQFALNLTGQASWENRNLFKRGHQLSTLLNANADVWIAARDTSAFLPIYSIKSALIPYTYPNFFHPKLSLAVVPQVANEITSLLSVKHPGKNFGTIKTTTLSAKTALVYQFDRYRSASLSRNFQYVYDDIVLRNNLFNENYQEDYKDHSFGLGGTLGWVDNFLNRQNGLLFTPNIEFTDRYFRKIPPNTAPDTVRTIPLPFIKTEANLTLYWQPFRKWNSALSRFGIAGRLFVGQVWAKGYEDLAPNQQSRRRISYFAGGSNDVRGWGTASLGDKIIENSGTVSKPNYRYIATGGLGKMLHNWELRYQFESFPALEMAIFRDKGILFSDKISLQNLSSKGFKSLGVGARFSSAFGVARMEFSRKTNPLPYDLQNPDGGTCNSFGFIQGCGKWRLDLSFSQAF